MNITGRMGYLDGVKDKHHSICLLAWQYLNAVNGAQNLGLQSMHVTDFTPWEFEIMTYLSGQIQKLNSVNATRGQANGQRGPKRKG